MALQIVTDVETELSALAGVLSSDLGVFGSGLAAAIKYDTQKAFDAAVAAGKYAANTFIALVKDDLSNYWITVKDQIGTAAASLLATFSTGGFQAAVDQATKLLGAIDWRAVATSLTGIAMATLATTARATITMLISGVLAAA